MTPTIGERIREARRSRGLTLRALADRIGVHYAHLSKVENGKDTIGEQSLIRIAEELSEDPDMMLGHSGHRTMPFRVLGDIAAGAPIEAIEDVDTFDLAKSFDPHEHFLLRVKGDSMIEDGINHGDLAMIRPTKEAKTGDTVVAIVDGEATLKRFKKNKQTVVLIPANEDMESMKYPAADVEIRGVLVGVVRAAVK